MMCCYLEKGKKLVGVGSDGAVVALNRPNVDRDVLR